MNATYEFVIDVDTVGPLIEQLTLDPEESGYGTEIGILADITDATGVDTVMINVSYPNGTVLSIPMTQLTSQRYAYTFSDTWVIGQYNVTIIMNDTLGYISQNTTSFLINTTLDIEVATQEETYFANESVALTSPFSWWNTTWNYRISITADGVKQERPYAHAKYKINFSTELDQVAGGGLFDINSIRLVEYDSNGDPIVYNASRSGDDKYVVPIKFKQGSGYSITNAVGVLEFELHNATSANTARNYMLYFDKQENGLKSAAYKRYIEY
jgi:hypothetical protein